MSASPTRSRTASRRRGSSRAAILRAAERLFAAQGLAGARTEAIAAAAHVNKALLYYYFRSKDDLYLAVLEEQMRDFSRRAQEVLARGGSARARLLDYVSMHFDMISSRPHYPRLFPRLLLSGGGGLERLARKYSLPLGRALERLIARGVASREFRPVDGHQTVISLVALSNFYFLVAPVFGKVTGTDPYSPAQLARRKQAILDWVRYGLFRKPQERIP